ncbi:MAG: 50S ribosomal protein L18 [uncultured bacterium]|nr:MAG: 50S ribosomal protein L18 [uncultured bacterium]KKT75086.1 MAG: 50S ribosomal protein L18 [Candidatus Peregrinibacteria bacterium GW2011_GWA2_44_7]
MFKKNILRQRRHHKIKTKIKATSDRPRLVVYRSLQSIYAQLIDDAQGKTLVSSSDMKVKKGTKMERAAHVGKELAEKAMALKIETCVFDRNGYKYHGRVKAVAEGAREGGLKF